MASTHCPKCGHALQKTSAGTTVLIVVISAILGAVGLVAAIFVSSLVAASTTGTDAPGAHAGVSQTDRLNEIPLNDLLEGDKNLLPSLPPGSRVISLKYKLLGHSGPIFPGDRVDALIPGPTVAPNGAASSDRILVQDVGVFAVDRNTISLVVNPTQAQQLEPCQGAAIVRPAGTKLTTQNSTPAEGARFTGEPSVIGLLDAMRTKDDPQ